MTLEQALSRYPGAETFTFGNSAEMSAALLALVRSGKKTATCGALRDYDKDGDPLPVVGRRDIALNWDGTPALAIETLEVTQRRFLEIEIDFVASEGEFEDFEGWRDGHRRYFERNGGWDPEMKLVCERFRLIEDFA